MDTAGTVSKVQHVFQPLLITCKLLICMANENSQDIHQLKLAPCMHSTAQFARQTIPCVLIK